MRKLLPLLLLSSSLFGEYSFLVDKDFSPFSGASHLNLLQQGIVKLDDRIFDSPPSHSSYEILGRALGASAWAIVNSTLAVAQHEIYGHGYRLRDLNMPIYGYEVEPFSGATYFDMPDDQPFGDLLAVGVGGLEGEAVFANELKMDFIRAGKLDGRTALTYFYMQQSLFFYTALTHNICRENGKLSNGNDIGGYLYDLAEVYPQDSLGIGDLMLYASFSWLDPMTFLSVFSYYYYVAEGTSFSLPMISLTENLSYLPNVRIGFAPYAPEIYLENFFSLNDKVIYNYFKGGGKSAGVGLFVEELFHIKKASFGLHLDGWAHRQFSAENLTFERYLNDLSVAAPHSWIVGGAASITANIPLTSSIELFVELGGKSKGYLPGYSLSSGLVARGGINLAQF